MLQRGQILGIKWKPDRVHVLDTNLPRRLAPHAAVTNRRLPIDAAPHVEKVVPRSGGTAGVVKYIKALLMTRPAKAKSYLVAAGAAAAGAAVAGVNAVPIAGLFTVAGS